MIPQVLSSFEKLEAKKAKALILLKSKTTDELERHAPATWSLIQAMRHIQMSEEGSINYMLKKSQAGDQLKSRPFSPRMGLVLLNLVFVIRIKFKAPAAISNPPITSLEELENDWAKTRERLKEFLDQYPEKWKNKAVFRHPFIGLLNIEDAVDFMGMHLAHHTRQLRRIERQIKTLNASDSK